MITTKTPPKYKEKDLKKRFPDKGTAPELGTPEYQEWETGQRDRFQNAMDFGHDLSDYMARLQNLNQQLKSDLSGISLDDFDDFAGPGIEPPTEAEAEADIYNTNFPSQDLDDAELDLEDEMANGAEAQVDDLVSSIFPLSGEERMLKLDDFPPSNQGLQTFPDSDKPEFTNETPGHLWGLEKQLNTDDEDDFENIDLAPGPEFDDDDGPEVFPFDDNEYDLPDDEEYEDDLGPDLRPPEVERPEDIITEVPDEESLLDDASEPLEPSEMDLIPVEPEAEDNWPYPIPETPGLEPQQDKEKIDNLLDNLFPDSLEEPEADYDYYYDDDENETETPRQQLELEPEKINFDDYNQDDMDDFEKELDFRPAEVIEPGPYSQDDLDDLGVDDQSMDDTIAQNHPKSFSMYHKGQHIPKWGFSSTDWKDRFNKGYDKAKTKADAILQRMSNEEEAEKKRKEIEAEMQKQKAPRDIGPYRGRKGPRPHLNEPKRKWWNHNNSPQWVNTKE